MSLSQEAEDKLTGEQDNEENPQGDPETTHHMSGATWSSY